MFLGSIEGFRRYRHLQARSAELSFQAPVEYHCDGEPEGREDSLRIEVRPRTLAVRVPSAVADRSDGPFSPPPSS
jgi:diacylglycerol kinase family enzyme